MLRIIKNVIFLFTALVFIASKQISNQKLYLLYTPDNKRVSQMCLDETPVLLYKIQQNNKRIITIAFTALDTTEIQVDDLESLRKTYRLQNIDWLTEKFLAFYDYFEGEKPYKTKDGKFKVFDLNSEYQSIYVVVPVPNSKKAQVFRVGQNPSFDID